jgi:hypothetical protein
MQRASTSGTYLVLVDEHGLLHPLERHDLAALPVATEEHLAIAAPTEQRQHLEILSCWKM